MSLRDSFRKTDNKSGEAATREDTSVVPDEAPDDDPFGLDVWVEGVDDSRVYLASSPLFSDCS
jgi:hypothetical protein